MYRSQGKVSLILVPASSWVKSCWFARVFGTADIRNLKFWTGNEVRKLYGKAIAESYALVLAVSWIFLFDGCLPHHVFKFIVCVEKHNPSVRCLIREPVLLIACIKIFNMLLCPSSGSLYPPVLLAAAVGAVAGVGPDVPLTLMSPSLPLTAHS